MGFTITTTARSLNTTYTPSATRHTLVVFTVRIALSSLNSQETGLLDFVTDSSSPPTTRQGGGRLAHNNGSTLSTSTMANDVVVVGWVKPNENYRLNSTSSAGNPVFTVVSTMEVSFDAVDTGDIADSAITAAKIAAGAVTLPKLERRTSGAILIGQGTGADVAEAVPSGDVTVSTAGVTTIGADKVTTSKINAQAVTLAKMERRASGAILVGQGAGSDVAEKVPSGDITMDANAVTAIGAGKVTTTKILDANVTIPKLSFDPATQTELDAEAAARAAADALLVPKTTTITAGNGLTGGGDLSTSRTFDVNPGTGIAIVGDAVTNTGISSVGHGLLLSGGVASLDETHFINDRIGFSAAYDATNHFLYIYLFEKSSQGLTPALQDYGSFGAFTLAGTTTVEVLEGATSVLGPTNISTFTHVSTGLYRTSYTYGSGTVTVKFTLAATYASQVYSVLLQAPLDTYDATAIVPLPSPNNTGPA